MRQNSKPNPREVKRQARLKYAERQIDNFVKWSFGKRNCVKFKDIAKLQDQYNIQCYG